MGGLTGSWEAGRAPGRLGRLVGGGAGAWEAGRVHGRARTLSLGVRLERPACGFSLNLGALYVISTMEAPGKFGFG